MDGALREWESLTGELLDAAASHLPPGALASAREDHEGGEWYLALYRTLRAAEAADLVLPWSLLERLAAAARRVDPPEWAGSTAGDMLDRALARAAA